MAGREYGKGGAKSHMEMHTDDVHQVIQIPPKVSPATLPPLRDPPPQRAK
jgi:hypothetical protein